MANALYDKAREGFLNGDIDWTSDTIKVVLLERVWKALNDRFFRHSRQWISVKHLFKLPIFNAKNTFPYTLLDIAVENYEYAVDLATDQVLSNACLRGL